MPRTAYHRISDDSVSSGPVATVEAAIKEARTNMRSRDIDEAWVRDDAGEVVWRSHRVCPVCHERVPLNQDDSLRRHTMRYSVGDAPVPCQGAGGRGSLR